MAWNDTAETGIDHLYGNKHCSISTGERTLLQKLLQYTKDYPEDVKLIAKNQDGSCFFHIPWKWVKISPPRQYTEEQRQAMRERFETVRKYGQQSSET